LYVYARRPPEKLIRLCEEHGIIMDSGSKRIARKLIEMDKPGQRAS